MKIMTLNIEFNKDVYRKIDVPADISLEDLHNLNQLLFNFDDDHPYEFYVFSGHKQIIITMDDFSERSLFDENYKINSFLKTLKDPIYYTFDFGDNWNLTITLEKIREDETAIVCLEGNGCINQYPEEDEEYWYSKNKVNKNVNFKIEDINKKLKTFKLSKESYDYHQEELTDLDYAEIFSCPVFREFLNNCYDFDNQSAKDQYSKKTFSTVSSRKYTEIIDSLSTADIRTYAKNFGIKGAAKTPVEELKNALVIEIEKNHIDLIAALPDQIYNFFMQIYKNNGSIIYTHKYDKYLNFLYENTGLVFQYKAAKETYIIIPEEIIEVINEEEILALRVKRQDIIKFINGYTFFYGDINAKSVQTEYKKLTKEKLSDKFCKNTAMFAEPYLRSYEYKDNTFYLTNSLVSENGNKQTFEEIMLFGSLKPVELNLLKAAFHKDFLEKGSNYKTKFELTSNPLIDSITGIGLFEFGNNDLLRCQRNIHRAYDGNLFKLNNTEASRFKKIPRESEFDEKYLEMFEKELASILNARIEKYINFKNDKDSFGNTAYDYAKYSVIIPKTILEKLKPEI